MAHPRRTRRPGRRPVADPAGAPHRPHTGRLLLFGGVAAADRAGSQLRPGHHPPLLHGGPGPGGRCPRRHGRLGAWARRVELFPRLALAAAVVATAVWSFVLLGWSPGWYPVLRWTILVGGLAPPLPSSPCPRARGRSPQASPGSGSSPSLAGPPPTHSTRRPRPTPGPSRRPDRPSPAPRAPAGSPAAAVGSGPGRPVRSGRRRVPRGRWWVHPVHTARGRQVPGRGRRFPGRGRRVPGSRDGLPRRSGAGTGRNRRLPGWRCGRRTPQGVHAGKAARGTARGRRVTVRMGGGYHRVEFGLRLPAGHRPTGDGHRRVQRHRPLAHAGPVPSVRGRGPDPLLHRRRWRVRPRRPVELGLGLVGDRLLGCRPLHRPDRGRRDRLRPLRTRPGEGERPGTDRDDAKSRTGGRDGARPGERPALSARDGSW